MKNENKTPVPTLSAQGAHVPVIGLGTWKLDEDDCQEVVETALEVGYRHVDTARAYGNEAAVGRALSRSAIPRDELFVTTKIFLEDLSRERAKRAVEESATSLALDVIDLVLIHWPSESVPVEETLDALNEMQRAGLVRHLGVSNFTPSQLEVASRRNPLLCNQVEYHPFLAQDEQLAAVRERGMFLTAYCPLAQGRTAEDSVLQGIGERHDKSAVQVALRWLVQQEGVVAIPKASSREHLQANIDVFDFELTSAEMDEVAGLASGERLVDPEFAPAWGA